LDYFPIPSPYTRSLRAPEQQRSGEAKLDEMWEQIGT